VKFFFLPPYLPEYNPAEQVWKWSKPLVHAAKTINGGLEELLYRFKKLFAHRLNNRLATPLHPGMYTIIIYAEILISLHDNFRVLAELCSANGIILYRI